MFSETRYARVGDVRVAYQVVGDHGPDLLLVPTGMFPIDLIWDEPTVAGHLRRLASFSRLILTDLVGGGSSDDLLDDEPALQLWVDGLLAVLDAVGSESASPLRCRARGCPLSSWPRAIRNGSAPSCSGSPHALYARAPDHPFGMPEATLRRYVDLTGEMMGTGAIVDRLAPSWSGDAAKRRWWGAK